MFYIQSGAATILQEREVSTFENIYHQRQRLSDDATTQAKPLALHRACSPKSFSPEPTYKETTQFTTTIAADGDLADIYYPVVPHSSDTEFPIALLLQGALVDKADYSEFASEAASYGFIVVVPNNERTIPLPNGQPLTGLLSEQQQVTDVLAQMQVEDADLHSPIAKIVDTERLGLLGHSFGGAVGVGASQEEVCIPGICSDSYTKPPELMAGIFYGASFRDPVTNAFPAVNNQEVPLGLILGDRDGVVQPFSSENTYDQILNLPKALITLEGANHYGITNQDNLVREPNRPTLDQETGIETIARWSALFLQAHLQDNKGAFNYIYNTGDALAPNIRVMSQSMGLGAKTLMSILEIQ